MPVRTQSRCINRLASLMFCFVLVSPTASVAQDRLVLNVRHDHAWGNCSGTLTLDDRGARYETTHAKDARNWTYEDVQQFQVEESRRLRILTYEDRKWRLGVDKAFEFDWQGNEPTPEEVYQFIQARVRRPIAAELLPSGVGEALYEFPVKHLGVLRGVEGRLRFTDRWIVLQAEERLKEKERSQEKEKNTGNRTWRYDDLESISSSGPYELTLTTYEQQKFRYASRRVYRFQLKEALPPETYDTLWRFVNGKKGRQ